MGGFRYAKVLSNRCDRVAAQFAFFVHLAMFSAFNLWAHMCFGYITEHLFCFGLISRLLKGRICAVGQGVEQYPLSCFGVAGACSMHVLLPMYWYVV